MDNMLSKALREFTTGPLNQLLVNMGGKNGDKVYSEFLKFNRGEQCYATSPSGIIMPDDNVVKTMDAVARLSEKGYLDTSFDGRAVHPLIIRPLTRTQAFDRHCKSGGETWVGPRIKELMPYKKPQAQLILAMNMQFRRDVESDDAIGYMDELDVQPFFGEWLIQYGCKYPEYQKENTFVALGAKFDVGGTSRTLVLGSANGHGLYTDGWSGVWGDRFRFLVVLKGTAL